MPAVLVRVLRTRIFLLRLSRLKARITVLPVRKVPWGIFMVIFSLAESALLSSQAGIVTGSTCFVHDRRIKQITAIPDVMNLATGDFLL